LESESQPANAVARSIAISIATAVAFLPRRTCLIIASPDRGRSLTLATSKTMIPIRRRRCNAEVSIPLLRRRKLCHHRRMKNLTIALLPILSMLLLAPACAERDPLHQSRDALIEGETLAVAYSGFRAGQHPDRGDGAVNPSRAEILEDLRILADAGFRLIRMYDSGENTRATLELIREHDLPIRMMVGAWLSAEVSNHEGCGWLHEPIPEAVLAEGRRINAAEIERAIELANAYPDIVVAVNVGNEMLVDWNDHMVPLEKVIGYVRRVREGIEQPVTVAENYAWWIRHGAPLAAELDFVGVHSYPVWEGKTIDDGLSYTLENLAGVREALPDAKLAVLECGWATTASEFGERAGEAQQVRYYAEMKAWAEATNTTVFFFEAFDEPWKGDPGNPLGAEKHWGLWFESREPKLVMQGGNK